MLNVMLWLPLAVALLVVLTPSPPRRAAVGRRLTR